MWRKLLPNLFLLVVSVALSLGVAELAVRAFGWAPIVSRLNPALEKSHYRFSDNPVLGYVFKEGYRDPDSDLIDSFPYVNSHGFRDVERSRQKPRGGRRIIVLGDSVVAGAGAIRELGETIPGQLERLLGDGVEVLNFGVNGYCTAAEVELLEERGHYGAELVILLFVGNDYQNMNNDLGLVTARRSAMTDGLFIHSHLFRLASLRLDLWQLRQRYGLNGLAGSYVESEEQIEAIKRSDDAAMGTVKRHLLSIGDDNVATGLEHLRHLADERGFEVVVALWPTFTDEAIVDLETCCPQASSADAGTELRIEQLARGAGFPTVRLSPYFRQDYAAVPAEGGARATPNDYYTIGDTMHPTPVAALVAARALRQTVVDAWAPSLPRTSVDQPGP